MIKSTLKEIITNAYNISQSTKKIDGEKTPTFFLDKDSYEGIFHIYEYGWYASDASLQGMVGANKNIHVKGYIIGYGS